MERTQSLRGVVLNVVVDLLLDARMFWRYVNSSSDRCNPLNMRYVHLPESTDSLSDTLGMQVRIACARSS